MASIKVYADTSVFGGVFDQEFEDPSRAFFDQVSSRRFRLMISEPVQAELMEAPEQVREWWDKYLPLAEFVSVTTESIALQQAYLKAGIVTPKWETDALHVALASVNHCRAIVSWNFKHIVHFDKIPLYNGVNLINGFEALSINSPAEVIEYEE